VKYFDWDNEKNEWLMQERGISFETCVTLITGGFLLDVIPNHHPYEHQSVYIIEVEGYCYRVPFVEDEEKIFLKTAYPSHEATKKYLT
jgi:uncharacterized DUF497 family protein